MKGDPIVIQHLNKQLKNELTAINQYFLHARMLDNWGLKELGEHEYKESIEEMEHADAVIERILFLGGVPNMQRLSPVRVGENPVEMHEVDLALEVDAAERLNRGIQLATQAADNGTRALLEGILKNEEEAIDWLEGQLGIIKDIGKERYLAEMIGEIE